MQHPSHSTTWAAHIDQMDGQVSIVITDDCVRVLNVDKIVCELHGQENVTITDLRSKQHGKADTDHFDGCGGNATQR